MVSINCFWVAMYSGEDGSVILWSAPRGSLGHLLRTVPAGVCHGNSRALAVRFGSGSDTGSSQASSGGGFHPDSGTPARYNTVNAAVAVRQHHHSTPAFNIASRTCRCAALTRPNNDFSSMPIDQL